MKTTSLLSACVAAGMGFGVMAMPAPLTAFDFEEGVGAFADSAIGAPRSAELSSSAKWAKGPFGSALATGGDERAGAALGALNELNGDNPFTIFLRFRREGANSGKHACLLSTADWGNGGLLFFIPTGDALNVRVRAGKEGPETSIPAFEKLTPGKWHSVAFVYTRGLVKAYADGKLAGTRKWNYSFRAKDFTLGSWGTGSFGGFIDDFRVWQGELAASAIAELAEDSRYAEIEGYQDDGTGGIGKIEVLPQIPANAKPVAKFSNSFATLAIDALGAVVSLKEQATGRELVANPVPFLRVSTKDGRMLVPRRFEKRGENRLAWIFAHGMGEVETKVEPFEGGWAFRIVACSLKEVERLEFARVECAAAKWRGTFANAASDEKSAVCVRSGDIQGEPFLAGSGSRKAADGPVDSCILGVRVDAKMGFVGRSAFLAAGAREGFRGQLAAMTRAAGAPASDCGGANSMGSEVARWSYVFAPIVNGDVDYWIDFTKRAGFSIIHFNSSWTDCLGHCPVNRRAFPDGLEGMKAAADKIHAAGLHAGMHTLTACINPRDPWITPVCNTNLVADAVYTLAADLEENAKELFVEELPISRHATVFTYSSNGNVLRIGNELLQYSGIRRDAKPYAFTGLKRGAFGTKKLGRIAKGTQVDYLHQRYIAFYPKPDSPLADELADRLAEVYNTCSLDEFYFDGSEGMGTRYGVDWMRHHVFSRLKANNGHSPSIEASCQNANNWWFQTRTATTDHGVYGVKRFHDFHINWGVKQGRLMNFLEPQMGWWQPRVDVPKARGHFLDEMEYFAGKNAGHDAAMSLQGVNARPLPIGVRRQLTILGWYEYARLARAFTPDAINRLAGERTEARLRQNDDGEWELEDVEEFKHRAGFAWDRKWNFESAAARSAALRVEALYSAAQPGSGVPLVKADDFAAFQPVAAGGVKQSFKAGVAGEHGAACRMSAANQNAEPNGAWARVRRQFDFPGLDVGKGNLAFGLWVKGDGSGALVNLQLEGVPEFLGGISDHYVRLDFTGWKYITCLLRERDAGEFWKYIWPYGGGYAPCYRSMIYPEHIRAFTVYLNDIPRGGSATVEFGEVEALAMVPGAELENASVKVNGESFALPFALAAGEYAELDGAKWIKYSALGTALTAMDAEKSPRLAAGFNQVELVAPAGARAELTFFARDNRRAALVEELSQSQRAQMRYEGVMPFEYAPKKGLLPPRVVATRPGETARLEIEVKGPAKNPAFTFPKFFGFMDDVFTFPVTIAADEKLVCVDGAAWRVEKLKDGQRVSEGRLENPMPLLDGTTRLNFSAELAEGEVCEVDLLKNYQQ